MKHPMIHHKEVIKWLAGEPSKYDEIAEDFHRDYTLEWTQVPAGDLGLNPIPLYVAQAALARVDIQPLMTVLNLNAGIGHLSRAILEVPAGSQAVIVVTCHDPCEESRELGEKLLPEFSWDKGSGDHFWATWKDEWYDLIMLSSLEMSPDEGLIRKAIELMSDEGQLLVILRQDAALSPSFYRWILSMNVIQRDEIIDSSFGIGEGLQVKFLYFRRVDV